MFGKKNRQVPTTNYMSNIKETRAYCQLKVGRQTYRLNWVTRWTQHHTIVVRKTGHGDATEKRCSPAVSTEEEGAAWRSS